jgi:predicted RNA-binding protein (virulence factor B family)
LRRVENNEDRTFNVSTKKSFKTVINSTLNVSTTKSMTMAKALNNFNPIQAVNAIHAVFMISKAQSR